MSCSQTWMDQISGAVIEGLSPGERAGLRAHLGDCEACRRTYAAACAGIARLEGRADALPEAVVAGLASDLFSALDAEEPRPLRFAAFVPAGSSVRRATIATLAAAALASVVLYSGAPDGGDPSLTPRGGSARSAGFTAFCIRVEGGEPRIAATAHSGTTRAARCALSDRLQFTYSLAAEADEARSTPRRLALLSVGPEGQVNWYWPRGEGGPALTRPVLQAPLPGSFDLSVRHAPGRWRIFGVFGDEALSRAELERTVQGQVPSRALRALESPQGIAVEEVSLELISTAGEQEL